MDLLTLLPLLLFGVYLLNRRDQRDRITLLGSYLSRYRIEKLMENLMQGYMRALGESDPARQAAIWSMLSSAETELSGQFNAFTLDFAKVDEAQTRVSKLALALPYASRWLASQTFDLRKALGIHAHALAQATSAGQPQDPKRKAFTLMAELMLMQHTCHWFCRSRTVASTRLLARHQTTYEQVLAAVAPDTRQAYLALIRA
ncbi:hypothetical protein [Rhodoferax sp.]|uniref:hypothetical protein n=1 Tax=Rhodoferax sp. TaxID=50421 RepID=UPI00260B1738|nr:hypothetical protein [Rhodoferax sp.]MDD2923561.1 hypothetical protein [Rhodoferax sp.]